MADTAIAITAGTGTNVDTRTEGTNGNHRQVVVLGDPATNAGVAPVDATAGLKVDLGADNDVTVSGTVTANIGTGTLAAVTTVSTVTNVTNIATSVTPGTSAAHLGKAVDAVAGASDTGVAILAVRDNALSTLTPAEGDYAPLRVNGNGAMWVTLDPVVNNNGQATMANSAAVVIASDQTGIPVALDTNRIANGPAGTMLTPVRVAIAASSSGDNSIVAAAGSGNKIRVLQWLANGAGAVNFKWRSAATDKTGLFYVASAGGGAGGAFNPIGHFETAANEALNLNLSGAVAVGGYLTYVVVT